MKAELPVYLANCEETRKKLMNSYPRIAWPQLLLVHSQLHQECFAFFFPLLNTLFQKAIAMRCCISRLSVNYASMNNLTTLNTSLVLVHSQHSLSGSNSLCLHLTTVQHNNNYS